MPAAHRFYPDDDLHNAIAHQMATAPRRTITRPRSGTGEYAALTLTHEQAGTLHDPTVLRYGIHAHADRTADPKASATARAYRTLTNRLTRKGIISATRTRLLAERVLYATRWTELTDDSGTVLARVYHTSYGSVLDTYMEKIGATRYHHLRYADLTPAERAHIHHRGDLF